MSFRGGGRFAGGGRGGAGRGGGRDFGRGGGRGRGRGDEGPPEEICGKFSFDVEYFPDRLTSKLFVKLFMDLLPSIQNWAQ